MFWRLLKNLDPAQSSHAGDRVGEGDLFAGMPWETGRLQALSACMPMEDQAHNTEEAKQAGSGPQHALFRKVPWCVESQMGPRFLEGYLDAPAARVQADHLLRRHAGLGAKEVFVPMRALDVVNMHPADGNQPLAGLVPVSLVPDQSDAPALAAIPVDREGFGPGIFDRIDRLGQSLSFDSWPASPGGVSVDRQCVQVGLGMKAAEQAHVSAMPMTEARQLVAGVSAVAQKDELSIWKPVNQRGHQLHRQKDGRLMPPMLALVQLRRPIQRAQHRQGPGPGGEGELDVDRQHHPLVAPDPHHVTMRRSTGIVMTPFAINVFALVLRRGVVHRTNHRLIDRDKLQHHRGQYLPQRPTRPNPATEHAMKIRPMSLRQWTDRSEHGGDGAMPQGKNRAEHQNQHTLESRASKCYRERRNKRLRRLGKTNHIGLLSDSPSEHQRMYGGVRFVGSLCLREPPIKNGKSRA
jgi:hypothetical protein